MLGKPIMNGSFEASGKVQIVYYIWEREQVIMLERGWACCYMSNRLPGDGTARAAGLGTTLGMRGELRPGLGA